jgi:hypothetical protein
LREGFQVAALERKIQEALDEGRILVLGTQVLIGFGYRSFLEERFVGLPTSMKLLKLAALGLQLITFGLIVFPAAWHRVVERGHDTPRQLRIATRLLGVALLPLGLGLAFDVTFAAQPAAGSGTAIAIGAGVGIAAVGLWYVWTGMVRVRHASVNERKEGESEMPTNSVENRIRHVLTEARMMLPGALALLGFELGSGLLPRFRELPRPAQEIHVAAICLTALSVLLLVTPAAYHRIAEAGEDTPHFHRVASWLVGASLLPLGIALGAEMGVVTYASLGSAAAAITVGGVAAAFLLAAWFGVTLVARVRSRGGRLHAHRVDHARA